MAGFFISRTWRTRKLMLGLLLLEFALTVPVLTLFGIANPNLYRTKLWQEGGDLGYNSAPNTVLYAMANYRPVKTPLVWSQLSVSLPSLDVARKLTRLIVLPRGTSSSRCFQCSSCSARSPCS